MAKGILALVAILLLEVVAGAKHEQVLLSDVKVLTLYRDQYTTGRRAPPIQQLKCVGGSASKSAYHPDVVQCYNRGSDGMDVQWECKANLDNAVRFGKINVYCEGYNYPDDPYILKGSCGLEYNLEYVSGAGSQKRDQKSYFKSENSDVDTGSGFIIFLIACAVIFFIYMKCLRPSGGDQPEGGQQRFRGGGPPPPPPYGGPPPPYDDRPSAPPGDSPPPYGFRPEHYSSPKQGASASGSQEQEYRQQRQAPPGAHARAGGAAAGDGPGFWTGLGTGGVLGYLFGSSTGGGRHYQGGNSWFQPGYASRTRHTYGDDRDFGFFSGSNSSAGTSASSSGMGTRTASGYGGTRRR